MSFGIDATHADWILEDDTAVQKTDARDDVTGYAERFSRFKHQGKQPKKADSQRDQHIDADTGDMAGQLALQVDAPPKKR